MDEAELELLLSLDGAAYEMAPGVIVEFAVRRTPATQSRCDQFLHVSSTSTCPTNFHYPEPSRTRLKSSLTGQPGLLPLLREIGETH